MVDKSTDRENDVMVRQFVFQFVFFRACVFPKNYKFKTVKVIAKKQKQMVTFNCLYSYRP